jgi:DNA-binding response OmpR family regulator
MERGKNGIAGYNHIYMAKPGNTILVVEDEAPTSLALCDKLEHEGYTVLRENNGKDGLATALKEQPDLILADLKMPEMNGMEMIRALREDSWGKDAKVIILTNMSDVAKIEEAMVHGAFYYMVKGDSSMNDIVEKVRSQLGPAK